MKKQGNLDHGGQRTSKSKVSTEIKGQVPKYFNAYRAGPGEGTGQGG